MRNALILTALLATPLACGDAAPKSGSATNVSTNASSGDAGPGPNATTPDVGLPMPSEGPLDVTPDPIFFVETAVGQSEAVEVRVTTRVDAAVEITELLLISDDSDGAAEFAKGEFWPGPPFELTEPITFEVLYRPLNTDPDAGEIVFGGTVDGTPFEQRVGLRSPDLEGDIFATRTVDFGEVGPVDESTRDTIFIDREVTNIGAAPLVIQDVLLVEAGDFSIAFPATTDTPPGTGSATPPATLAPSESFLVRVFFNPESKDPQSAELVIFSSDPDTPEYVIGLVGNQ